MGDIVNLNHYRKRRERQLAKQRKSERSARSSRLKAERDSTRHDAEHARRDLDGKRIESTPGDEPA